MPRKVHGLIPDSDFSAAMSDFDREKWNARYAAGDHASPQPSSLLTRLDETLPRQGRALDVAGGAGRHAIWLAQRGLDVTLSDISPVGLELAKVRAEQSGLPLATLELDLEDNPFPPGPWDVIVSFHFLRRSLFMEFQRHLSPGGWLVFVQATASNLQRHSRPPAAFLLADDELPGLASRLAPGLQIRHYEQGWLADDQHVAYLVAQRQA